MHRKHFLQKISPAIVAAVALSTAAAASSRHTAAIDKPMLFAQAGSTGGTIGKQDKSASGGEVPERARRAPARKHHVAMRAQRAPLARQHHFSEAAHTRASCRKFTGAWSSWARGLFGNNDTVFNNDGTIHHASGITGTWTCLDDGVIFIVWQNGDNFKTKLSPDGKKLLGTQFVR